MIHEQDTLAGDQFSMTVATSTGIAAGHIIAAAAAANTQIAVFNPVGSGVNLVLSELRVGVVSGTLTGAVPLYHGIIQGLPTLASSGTAKNCRIGGPGSQTVCYSSAAGAALTGGLAPTTYQVSALATGGALVALANAVDDLAGELVIPQGYGWVPLWTAAGTTVIVTYTLTWKERPA